MNRHNPPVVLTDASAPNQSFFWSSPAAALRHASRVWPGDKTRLME